MFQGVMGTQEFPCGYLMDKSLWGGTRVVSSYYFGPTLKGNIFFTWLFKISKPPYVPFPKMIELCHSFIIFRFVIEKLKVTVSFDHPVFAPHKKVCKYLRKYLRTKMIQWFAVQEKPQTFTFMLEIPQIFAQTSTFFTIFSEGSLL